MRHRLSAIVVIAILANYIILTHVDGFITPTKYQLQNLLAEYK